MKNKYKICKPTINYTKIPNKIFTINISGNAFLLYMKCLSLPEKFNPSKMWLSQETGLSRWTINRSFNELLSKNLLICTRIGKRHIKSIYEFVSIKEWKI